MGDGQKKRKLAPLERIVERELKALRLELFFKVRKRLWEILPKKAVEEIPGPRCSKVRIGEAVFKVQKAGPVSLVVEPLPGSKTSRSPYWAESLKKSLEFAPAELGKALGELISAATKVAIRDTGVLEPYQEAVRELIKSHRAELLAPLRKPKKEFKAQEPLEAVMGQTLYVLPLRQREKITLYNKNVGGVLLKDIGGLAQRLLERAPDHFASTFHKYLVQRMTAGTAFGMPPHRLVQIGLKVLSTTIDRGLWTLVWKSSPKARVVHLHRFKLLSGRRRAFYEQVQADCPGMLKLFAWTFETGMSKEEQENLMASGATRALASVRTFWLGQGLTPAGWNLLHRQDPFQWNALMRMLLEWNDCPHLRGHDAMRIWARIVAESAPHANQIKQRFWKRTDLPDSLWLPLHERAQRAGDPWDAEWLVTIRHILFREMVRAEHAADVRVKEARAKLRTELGPSWRAGWKERFKKHLADHGSEIYVESSHFAQNVVPLVVDYVRAVGNGLTRMPVIPKGAGLAWLRRESDRWHQEHLLRRNEMARQARAQWRAQQAKRLRACWDPIPDIIEDRFKAVMLHTGRALEMEGRAMHHCVADYIEYCLAGDSRIFSIREVGTGKRIATMEISRAGKNRIWALRQVFRACNIPVDHETRKFAERVLAKSRPLLAKDGPPEPKKKRKNVA